MVLLYISLQHSAGIDAAHFFVPGIIVVHHVVPQCLEMVVNHKILTAVEIQVQNIRWPWEGSAFAGKDGIFAIDCDI